MYISYFDESGDDGFPLYSSPLFVLTSLYLYFQNWKTAFGAIHTFRERLKTDFGLPTKLEMHTKYFILNKNPYRTLNLLDDERIEIIDRYCDLVAQLDVRVVNIVINKGKIKYANYEVLDKALTYSIQRIENDLQKIDSSKRFMIITDEGRVGKMRATSRKIQKINFIPSNIGLAPRRQEIKCLIEDPLPKSSKESYFIQLTDMIAYIVYLYAIRKLGTGKYPNRLPELIDATKIIDWMERLKTSLNTSASREDRYGVVCYPK